MARLKDVIYISNEDYNTLITKGTVTINGDTLMYDSDTLYITPDEFKYLNTTNTSAQVTDVAESLSGSGIINLHKVSKTGNYNDLNNKLQTDLFQHNIIISNDAEEQAGYPGTISFSCFLSPSSEITTFSDLFSEISSIYGTGWIPASGAVTTSGGTAAVIYAVTYLSSSLVVYFRIVNTMGRGNFSIHSNGQTNIQAIEAFAIESDTVSTNCFAYEEL